MPIERTPLAARSLWPYWLLGGVLSGALAFNPSTMCLCLFWPMLCAAIGALLTGRFNGRFMTAGHGAVLGAKLGLAAAVTHAALTFANMQGFGSLLDTSELKLQSYGVPAEVVERTMQDLMAIANSSVAAGVVAALTLMFGAVFYTSMGALGGALGGSLAAGGRASAPVGATSSRPPEVLSSTPRMPSWTGSPAEVRPSPPEEPSPSSPPEPNVDKASGEGAYQPYVRPDHYDI